MRPRSAGIVLAGGVLVALLGCATPAVSPTGATSAQATPAGDPPAGSTPAAGTRSAHLARADQPGAGATWTGVRFDRQTGTCSTGVAPLMSLEEFERRSAQGRQGGTCTGLQILQAPDTTGYPAALSRAGIAGSAQVLVLVDETGRALEAHAVCSSVPAFAAAAEATALELRYRPSLCAGTPARAAALVPFAYDPR